MSCKYVDAGAKLLRCETHADEKPWPRGRGNCPQAPAPNPDTSIVVEPAAAKPETPRGLRSLEQRERKLTEIADYCLEQAKKITEADRGALKGKGKRSRPDQSLAIKWAAESIKAERAAAELGSPREREQRVRRREQKADALLAGRKRRRGGTN